MLRLLTEVKSTSQLPPRFIFTHWFWSISYAYCWGPHCD